MRLCVCVCGYDLSCATTEPPIARYEPSAMYCSGRPAPWSPSKVPQPHRNRFQRRTLSLTCAAPLSLYRSLSLCLPATATDDADRFAQNSARAFLRYLDAAGCAPPPTHTHTQHLYDNILCVLRFPQCVPLCRSVTSAGRAEANAGTTTACARSSAMK